MIVEVFNLGPIKKAMVDMCKPFIMFCGPNSTGKTYLSYLLYAINEDTSYFNAKILERVAKNLLIQRETLLSYDIIKEYVREFSIHIKSKLGSIFGLGDSMVDRLSIYLSINC